MNTSKVGKIISLPNLKLRTPMLFGLIIFVALAAFEAFNFSTTEFALHDLLGELQFAGIRWATILAIAFCGIDFAGIARLFTPQSEDESRETWYLFGAWLLAATMNAMLTWWGVSMAIMNHNLQSTTVMDGETVASVVPVFVAVMVWLIRILIIGTISAAADHLMGTQDASAVRRSAAQLPSVQRPTHSPQRADRPAVGGRVQPQASYTPASNTQSRPQSRPITPTRREPTYSNASFDEAQGSQGGNEKRMF